MANRHLFRNKGGIIRLPVDSAQIIEVGDMVALFTDDARRVSQLTYGTLAAAQLRAAHQFMGVAMEASVSGDTADITIRQSGNFEFDCAAATFEIGDLVAVDDNAGATALVDQQVIAAGENGFGIGHVSKRYSANTTRVLVEIKPNYLRTSNVLTPITFPGQLITSAVDLVTDWAVPFPFKLVQVDALVTVLTAGACDISIHNGATALDDVITIPTTSAVGVAVQQAMDDATGDDIFAVGGTLTIASDGVPTAGEAGFILWVKPFLLEA
ncbi:hypothetical protein LCGC14_2154500 [marine sediment metagenome]|uniref:Uncharacterized protein n=1 Tax=marine sediment metagenome TaxID=412755 RepID=A0A0F9EGT8_9ZZZZ